MPRGGVERTTKRRLVYKATDLVPHKWPIWLPNELDWSTCHAGAHIRRLA